MNSTITVKLLKPIEHNGNTYAELTFREALTGDFAIADKVDGEFAKTLAIMAGMAGVPLPVMQRIPMRDFTKIAAEVAAIMGEQPASTGSST